MEELVSGSSGGCWNLWFNVTLTDDPEATSWLAGLASR